MIHIYYGDGKGKTTAATGAAIRASAAGFRVLFYQFLKDGSSSEIKTLKKLDGIDYMNCTGKVCFMNGEDALLYRQSYQADVQELKKLILSGEYGMAVLDESIDAYNLGLFPEQDLLAIMDGLPHNTELVLTGHKYNGKDISKLIERADYVTDFVKEKHPYDKGVGARIGIEK